MNDGVNNPGIGTPGVNNPTAHSAGVGVNNVNNPAAAQGTVNPAAMHHQPGPQNPGVANTTAANNDVARDPALGAQQPHAHAHSVPHGVTQQGGTGNEHTSTSRATGAGEKFGHKLKSAVAQGQVSALKCFTMEGS
jgi:hypothetical protein